MRAIITALALATLGITATAAHADSPLVAGLMQSDPDLLIEAVRLVKRAERCAEAGLPAGCHEICHTTMSALGEEICALRAGPPPGVAVAEGYACSDHRCKKLEWLGDGRLRIDERVCGYPATGLVTAAVDFGEAAGDGGDDAAYMVDPTFYEWITGRDCCRDCWDAHRQMGLPCWMDAACCIANWGLVTGRICGIDPSCRDDEDGGDLEAEEVMGMLAGCGSPVQVRGVEVEYLGRRCLFDGRVDPLPGEHACAAVPGQGVIHSCQG